MVETHQRRPPELVDISLSDREDDTLKKGASRAYQRSPSRID